MSAGEFSTFIFLPDGTNMKVADHVDAREAVDTAADYTRRPAALLGIITRIIITDGGDFCVFEWKYSEGVTFPPRRKDND